MAFIPITIGKYIQHCKDADPSVDAAALQKRLETALNDYNQGLKCTCGNEIWVIGSAYAGNSCFSCFTGKAEPDGDFEIDTVLHKSKKRKGRRHIDDIPPMEIRGFFDDDGYEINIDLVKKPNLCLRCVHDDDPNEEMLCNLTRYDQAGEEEFVCYKFRQRGMGIG